ncbi:MAG: motility associated factor glycosyltransferase family protein [Lachnospiraceae bacterium]|nr:motility associated factor glycosyltransferase family protein [Lachnospiraceae bacterium]
MRKIIKSIVLRLGLYPVWLFIRYWIKEFPYEFIRNKKIQKGKLSRYEWLDSMHDKYLGERCFIICNGPSLTKEDYVKLKDEYTFGMNYICNWFYETGIETTFYVVQDYWARARYMKDDFDRLSNTVIFLSDHMFKKYGFEYEGKYNLMPASLKNLHYPQKMRRFQPNLKKGVSIGRSVAYPCAELAYYLGFRQIYLIGADCQIDVGGAHPEADGLYGRHEDVEFLKWNCYGQEETKSRGLILDQEIISKFCKRSDLKVFNATKGGALEVFPRVSLDEIIDVSKNH